MISESNMINIFMCGDVMTGRGIDQLFPHADEYLLHEVRLRSLRIGRLFFLLRHILPDFILYKRRIINPGEYVRFAEEANGAISRPVDFSYIWGDILEKLEQLSPDLRIINLETSITKSDTFWKDKGIHFKMHPDNTACLKSAGIDCCSLANNHLLDWGYSGLKETLSTLNKINIKWTGAGENIREAETPAVMDVEGKGRVVMFSFGSRSSGIPPSWAAGENHAGINLLPDLSDGTVRHISEKVCELKQRNDIVIASIHWGGNWSYNVPREQSEFAHKLIDEAGVDVIHGHSSHHVKGLEVHRGKLIMYGCGDFLNDYEGLGDYSNRFRKELGLMYFASFEPSTGRLVNLKMIPTEIKHLKVNPASRQDAIWLTKTLNRQGKKFGTRVDLNNDNILKLRWD